MSDNKFPGAAVYGLRLARDIANEWERCVGGPVVLLRTGDVVPKQVKFVFFAARSRNRPWHDTVASLMEICRSGVSNVLVVGSDAADGVNTTQGAEYHAEKAAELATVRRIAAHRLVTINMVSPRHLSHSGGSMSAPWVARVCVAFAWFAAKHDVRGQHIQL